MVRCVLQILSESPLCVVEGIRVGHWSRKHVFAIVSVSSQDSWE